MQCLLSAVQIVLNVLLVHSLNWSLTLGLKYWQASFYCACLSAAVFPEHVMLPTDQSASGAAEICGQDIQGCLPKARSLCIS